MRNRNLAVSLFGLLTSGALFIGNQKQNKMFILDLNSKTYTEKPYKHWANSANGDN